MTAFRLQFEASAPVLGSIRGRASFHNRGAAFFMRLPGWTPGKRPVFRMVSCGALPNRSTLRIERSQSSKASCVSVRAVRVGASEGRYIGLRAGVEMPATIETSQVFMSTHRSKYRATSNPDDPVVDNRKSADRFRI